MFWASMSLGNAHEALTPRLRHGWRPPIYSLVSKAALDNRQRRIPDNLNHIYVFLEASQLDTHAFQDCGIGYADAVHQLEEVHA
jgi:hypothetical protein